MYLTINALPWIPTATKARLLEWKIRMDLLQHAARGAPPLPLDKVATYVPRSGSLASSPTGEKAPPSQFPEHCGWKC